jgi:AAA domain
VSSLAQLLTEQPATPPARLDRAGLLPPAASCSWGASPPRSLFRAWRRCDDPWERPPTKTCWWTLAPAATCSAPQGLNHFLNAAREVAAEVIVLDPLYSTHNQDENDTRSMAALCQSLSRLRDASKAALIVVHHVRKSIGREEIGVPSRFFGAACGRRLLPVGDAAFGPSGGHGRITLPVSLRRLA